ncbi:unnamed protein product, partial [Meganyctiphanes norvegica]
MSSHFPYEFVELPSETQAEVMKHFLGYKGGLGEVKGPGHLIPMHYDKLKHEYYNFKFNSDDVVIVTQPKCGTTWTQEIVWCMRNNLDFQAAEEKALWIRAPFLEFDAIKPVEMTVIKPVLDALQSAGVKSNVGEEYLSVAKSIPGPRTIKTHLPFSLLPPDLLDTCKVIYVARNPRDACVSYYHHQRLIKCSEYVGDFPTFLDFWCRDLMLQGPYWAHVEEGWSRREHPNMLFMFYEDMKLNINEQTNCLNTFLGTNLSQAQLQKVVNFTDVGSMKKRTNIKDLFKIMSGNRPSTTDENYQVGKGTTGDWKNYITPQLDSKFDTWIRKWGHIADNVPFRNVL